MNQNISMLIKACNNLGYEYDILHESGNLVVVKNQGKSHVFVNLAAPLNSSSVTHLCRDKEYFYQDFKSHINMPKTKGYLNPNCNKSYSNYVKNSNVEEIANNIDKNFEYPVVLKKNKGSKGRNVFQCNERSQVINSLDKIYDLSNYKYDYVAISQEYIQIQKEFRALFLEGNLHCVYEKSITGAKFVGNLSRLHWKGAKAKIVLDIDFLEQIQCFCKPIFKNCELRYTGLDIVLDTNNKLWLIEANSAPGFDYFIRDCGEELVIEWYRKTLLLIFRK